MTPGALPDRPNLEQLKKPAKSLLHAAKANDPVALRRFTVLPALAQKSDTELVTVDLALHDAQSVIARELGFVSWNALRDEVEARTVSFDAAVDEFIRSATGGASGRAERLLRLHPNIASASLHTALVLGAQDAVAKRLRDRPELATEPGGPQNWEPLLYACHTSMHRTSAGSVDGLVTILLGGENACGSAAALERQFTRRRLHRAVWQPFGEDAGSHASPVLASLRRAPVPLHAHAG